MAYRNYLEYILKDGVNADPPSDYPDLEAHQMERRRRAELAAARKPQPRRCQCGVYYAEFGSTLCRPCEDKRVQALLGRKP